MTSFLRLLGIVLLFILVTTENAATPSRWTQNPYNPIIQPSQGWQVNSVFEPSVIYENGLFRMWYSGGTNMCILGYAESNDGVNWQPANGAILGGGAGGVSGHVCRNNVTKIDGVYYLTYSNGGGGHGETLWLATSADGLTFSTPRQLIDVGEWDLDIANSSVIYWHDEWWVYYEAHTPPGFWAIGSAHGKTLDTLTKTGQIQELQQANGGMYGGVSVHVENGGLTMFYHAAPSAGVLPTDIYTATSTDGLTWYPSPAPIIKRSQSWWQIDQVADPVFVAVNDKQFICYDGCDNRIPDQVVCVIGLAIQSP